MKKIIFLTSLLFCSLVFSQGFPLEVEDGLQLNGVTQVTSATRIPVMDANGVINFWIDPTLLDRQTLSISSNTLALQNGGSVDLSAFLDNVNNFVSSIDVSGTTTKTITLSREGLPDLTASFQDISGAGGDGNDFLTAVTESNGVLTFTVSGQNSLLFDLNAFLATKNYSVGAHIVNTDSQNLSISGTTLSLTDGGSVTLPTSAGPKGDTGNTGAVGPIGPKGDTGSIGATGPKGDKGDKGDTGDAGVGIAQTISKDNTTKLVTLSNGGGSFTDENTQLNESQVDAFVANNGYATTTQLNSKENSFTKKTAFNKNFGTTSGTVAQGNDSRINNGQTAFSWGNHASQGYYNSSNFGKTQIDALGINATLLDGLNSTEFVRSNVADTKIGNLILSSNQQGEPILGSTTNSVVNFTNGISYGLNVTVNSNGNTHLQSQRFDNSNAVYDIILQELGGNVGIGTASPTEKLDVNGTAKATSFKTGNWEIIQIGNDLDFKFNGTTRFRLKSDGTMEATNFKLGL